MGRFGTIVETDSEPEDKPANLAGVGDRWSWGIGVNTVGALLITCTVFLGREYDIPPNPIKPYSNYQGP